MTLQALQILLNFFPCLKAAVQGHLYPSSLQQINRKGWLHACLEWVSQASLSGLQVEWVLPLISKYLPRNLLDHLTISTLATAQVTLSQVFIFTDPSCFNIWDAIDFILTTRSSKWPSCLITSPEWLCLSDHFQLVLLTRNLSLG